MNILYITASLGVGGTEYYTLSCAKSFSRDNNVVWASVSSGAMKKIAELEGIKLLPCPLKRRNVISIYLALKSIRNIIKKYDIEIIHAVDAYSALLSSYAIKNLGRHPKLIWSNVGINSNSYYPMLKLCGKNIDGIIAVSNYIGTRLIETGFDPQKIVVCTQPRQLKTPSIDEVNRIRSELVIPKNCLVIGSVGRLVYKKGNHVLIEAFSKIDNTNARLVIVGDGPEKDNLVEQCRMLHIEDKVIFVGFQTEIQNYYGLFDIVAFPSFYEAGGYIVYESMFYSKPIIASSVGGIIENIENFKNGILVPPGKVEPLRNALNFLLTDENNRKNLSVAGNQFYRDNLTEKIATDEINRAYRSFIRNK